MALAIFYLIGKNKKTGEIKTVEIFANNMKEAIENLFNDGYYFIKPAWYLR